MRTKRSSDFFSAGIAALTLFGAASAVHAQDRDTVNIRTEDISTIEVIGERPLSEREVTRGVRDIAQSYTIGNPIERFLDPLCVTVAGLGSALNAGVAERIRENARAATLDIGADGCTTNALVIVVNNPDRLIDRLKEEQPRLFQLSSKRDIGAAINRGDEVIAWGARAIRGMRGTPLFNSPGLVGAGNVFENGNAAVPTTDTYAPSRTRIGYSVARVNSVVVFDVQELENVHLNQLADYATMYLIGSPRRLLDHDDLEAATILSLFEKGPENAPIGLTQLDRAYLRGLYSLRPNENATRLVASTRAAYSEIADNSCANNDAACEQGEEPG